MQRRQVFHALGAAFAASALGGSAGALAQDRRVDQVGLQLYTLRNEMGQDFEGALARVAEIGYREMEFAGYFGRSANEVRQALDSNGLNSPAVHVQLGAVRENLQVEIEFASTVGQQYLVVPSVPGNERSADDYRSHADTLNRAGEECRRAGLKMAYHNHDFEFEPTSGRIPYDILLEETDPELVAMELDLFWIVHAGHDPLEYIAAHPGRFSMLHVKDRDAAGAMVDVGSGMIDFAAIFANADSAGFRHYFVEHDNPGDGFSSVTNSFRAVRGLVF